MSGLASRIINLSTGAKKFGTKQVNFTALKHVYTLVQCTPDLSGYDCTRCLRLAMKKLPSGNKRGRVLFPSCNAMFEVYPFYLTGNTSTPLPMPVPPPPTPKAANEISIVESLQFDFATIEAATNKFSDDKKLGEGGFGQVYKGILANGQEIAVKRLSRSSGQGAGEFKNEVVLVAKLQHRNLVRLLGFCVEGEEKILVYEFVPNKSLDYFLYEPERHGKLDWSKRYKIIGGIARGMLYLHEDSRLKIIHCDLKASNVLLDENMNPKISDFGMAKIFAVDQTQANTSRVAGTFGYMSPEYVMHGQFSAKSDVYSFGILILVILSGKKINSFYQSDGPPDLLSFAWKHWEDGTLLEFLDPTLGDSYSRNEVIRCLQIGFLCVQENAVDRPTMASIVLMLNSNSITPPSPQNPAYLRTERNMPLSINEASITEVYPR
ncbi:cysteine-rich receptor-like protein kinase 10 isoform X2 [Quercus suber]|uniref:cysteine-rich receptor-like protein kinase 10 isoform X2 n=1 Tax=Quercus suber TaxID=58331 RepID=UPI0032E041FC